MQLVSAERRDCGRNTIVRDKTAAELLRLNERMESNLRKPGALEFDASSTS